MNASEPTGAGPKLDLPSFFLELQEQEYVLLKGGRTDGYESGADLDMFCADLGACSQRILAVGNRYVEEGLFEINVRTDEGSKHAYIDFYRDGALELRFDLRGALPRFRRVRLKDAYFGRVLRDRRELPTASGATCLKVFVPSETDDLLLRYIEYFEWYRSRPDKVKHLDYVIAAVTADPGKRCFLNRLHEYTDLPAPEESGFAGFARRVFRLRVRISDWSRWLREFLRRLRKADAARKSAIKQ